MAGPLDAILGYLSSLTQSQSPIAGPPPPGAMPAAGQPGGAAGPSTLSSIGTGATNFLGNPLTQAALGGYFNAIGSPRLAGLGGRIKAGGLGALDAFNQAETAREQGPLNAAKVAAIQQQNALTGAQTGLTQQKAEQLAGIAPANAALAAQIHASEQFMTPDQARRAHILETAITNDTSKVYDPKEVFAQIYEEPLKEQQITAQTSEATARQKLADAETGAIPGREALTKAQTDRLKNAPASGMTANWYDPTTKKFYRGAQRKPTDVLASVASRDTDLRTRAAWEKAYNDAKTKYITERTTTGFFGGKTPPTEADVDAYARAQADSIYGPLSSIGAGSASADEAEAAPPLPPGSTDYAVGPDGTVGHVTADGAFVPF